ncbi:MAG: AAA family ATPase [Clostridia bacterium]|nr:AAA family ATPase [Clostridia bacterium]
MKDENRIAIIRQYKEAFSVNADVPKDFAGIPILMNMSAWFFAYKANREENDIDNLWHLFEIALALADGDISKKQEFIDTYNQVITQRQVKWNITIGLYWVRPKSFLSLDSVSRAYLPEFNPPVGGVVSVRDLPEGKKYLWDIEELKRTFTHENTMATSFYELSQKAFEFADGEDDIVTASETNDGWWPSLEEYNPNLTKEDWKKYIFEIELPEHPCPMQMLKAMLELGGTASCKQLSRKFGGTTAYYVGCTMNLGRRVKKYFDLPPCMDGEQERYFPFPFLGKASDDKEGHQYLYKIRPELLEALNEIDLSEISSYYDSGDEKIDVSNTAFESYTKANFLNDVYISEEKYETCVSRLKHKKNLILQGAPGVGKTFAARRLAWSVMGVKDDNRIKFVQFHQSYSYEDFIMGYKPDGNGFSLEKGIFYDFCIKAKEDPDNDYFFIIDEINRGNMSKIFGELLMLIENDYRGMEITLAYDKKPFSVPKNLYIIGMMNTADRSLAMIDYALRRRFSFVEMTPGFDSEGFETYQSTINNHNFGKLIGRIKALNADIENDASLGKGFCIGHSYFCNLDADCSDTVLKEIVEYDIVPMLEEYWFDDEANAKNWSKDLSDVFNG